MILSMILSLLYYALKNLGTGKIDPTRNQQGKKLLLKKDDESRGTDNNQQIRITTSMLSSTLCNYSNAYILVSGTIQIDGARADDVAKHVDEINK